MKPAYLVHDNLDDRRQMHVLLCRLPPRLRLQFAEWCCRQSAHPGCTTRPGVARRTWRKLPAAEHDDSADRALSLELWFDLWALAMQYQMDLTGVLAALEHVVARFERRIPSSGRASPLLRLGRLDPLPLANQATVTPTFRTIGPENELRNGLDGPAPQTPAGRFGPHGRGQQIECRPADKRPPRRSDGARILQAD